MSYKLDMHCLNESTLLLRIVRKLLSASTCTRFAF